MIAPRSADDYLSALQALMPRGAAWPRDPSAVQTMVLRALAQTPARLDAAAVQLVADCFPITTQELLPEWEASLGLPDPVAGLAPSDDKRRRAVATRFAGATGFSRRSVGSVAGALGYDVAFQTYAAFRVGRNAVGDRLYDDQWANTVELTLTPSAAPPFADALTAWDLAFCKSSLLRMAGAQILVLFSD